MEIVEICSVFRSDGLERVEHLEHVQCIWNIQKRTVDSVQFVKRLLWQLNSIEFA